MSNHTTTFKAFPYAGQFYVYDANTNQLLRITKDIYLEICTLQKCGVADYRKQQRTTPAYIDTITLLNKGLFFTSFLKEIEHPDTNYLPEMIDRCINQLILGVTSACNFNCRYCHQATGKLLSKKSIMDKETAYRSVDFLYTHSKDAFDITITFYGGEPLLNFDLIKATVHYASNKFYTKSVSYNITTNASLMNAEIIHFFKSGVLGG